MRFTFKQKLASRLRLRPPPKLKFCVVCDQPVTEFAPYQGGLAAAPPLMRMLEMVGSDIDHFSCPSCHSHDRERHLLLYLRALGLLDRFRGADVLHFAPERRLAPMLQALESNRYVVADLLSPDPAVERIDMMQIPYAESTFDIVIANHVLEHVEDDRRALGELRRVLRPSGFAILQTPYSSRLHQTLADEGLDDDAARLMVYGQEDHVRLYGKDIFERFVHCGFRADIQRHDDALADFDPVKYGVNRNEPLFLFRRS